jgi:hypothetical protein
MQCGKLGFVHSAHDESEGWASHLMAPAPVRLEDGVIRVFVGGWDSSGISRIRYVDVDGANPKRVLGLSPRPVLDIGEDGCFDENGVFPAHAYRFENGRIYLYYTGFQLGHKIRHYNFGGLAVSDDNGLSFTRLSKAPLLDRADEGLFVRAGQSIESDGSGGYHVAYSAGSSWFPCNGKMRPVYDVFYQHSPDGIALSREGRKIIECDIAVEHGLGRPQIIRLGEFFYVFYTRRIIEGMRYFLGCSRSKDCVSWERYDDLFKPDLFGKQGEFDSEMVYFPAVLKTGPDKAFLFYSGNYYGRDGMGVMELAF